MPMIRAVLALLCVGSFAVVASACGGGSKGGSNSVTVTAPSGGGTPSVTIEAHDIFLKPNRVKAPAGKLKIDYVEDGSQQHTLVIQGVKGFKLTVSGSQKDDSATVDLQPGEYTYYCTIPGHRAQGMQGTLTISS
ncbi:MAG TPA: plastocyanin/azurin family copper-binding protein [Acidimicrobiia bacterium]|jgi:plastocyanin|nr:plastocyanin/azurin family copper-binding protein [Acidimicrobiia bacterium]